MSVLILVSNLDGYRVGATDGFIIDWVRSLAGFVDRLTVLTYRYNPKEQLPGNVSVVMIGGNNFFTRNVDLFKKTFELASGHDVIFAHILEVFGIAAGVVGKLKRRKAFFWYCQPYDFSKNLLTRCGFFLSDYILTCSEELKRRYISMLGEWVSCKITPVGHGIALGHYARGHALAWPTKKNRKVRIIYAGRVSPIKDVATLNKAVEILLKQKVNVSLKIYEKYAYANNYKVFQSGHIFVNSSRGYSLDKTLFEAVASGVTAIGSDNTYPQLAIKVPQMVFRAGDPWDLAKKIVWFIENPISRARVSSKAREYVSDNFSLETLMANIARTLNDKK